MPQASSDRPGQLSQAGPRRFADLHCLNLPNCSSARHVVSCRVEIAIDPTPHGVPRQPPGIDVSGALLPEETCHRNIPASTYLGSSSISRAVQPVFWHAIKVGHDPAKGSSTRSPFLLLDRITRSISSTGFITPPRSFAGPNITRLRSPQKKWDFPSSFLLSIHPCRIGSHLKFDPPRKLCPSCLEIRSFSSWVSHRKKLLGANTVLCLT
jgi:hypothetical protein